MDLKTWLRAQWDRVLGAGAVVVGLVAILLGYRGVAGTPFPAEQVPYVISGAVVGIALIGIGLTSWLSADLRDEWRKLDRLEHLLDERTGPAVLDDGTGAPGNGAVDSGGADDAGNGTDPHPAGTDHRLAAPGTRW